MLLVLSALVALGALRALCASGSDAGIAGTLPDVAGNVNEGRASGPRVPDTEDAGNTPDSPESPDAAVEIPQDLKPLAWLIGRWIGVGTGQYPTIEDFRFEQEVAFSCDGRPFLSYLSRSWLLDDEGARLRPLATEAGFWRARPGNVVEVTMAHPTGFAETWLGSLEVTGMTNAVITGARIDMRSAEVLRTPSAKDYSAGHRLYGLVNGRLLWTFDMAAMGESMTNHLAVTLSPVAPSTHAASEVS